MQFPRLFFVLASACVLSLSSCAKHSADDGHDHTTNTASSASQHGKPSAAVGSHEDWCAEHEVPESKCTRCDPKLAAAFKATGDWCQEHGLPESQCVQCDPTRKMTRPPTSGAK